MIKIALILIAVLAALNALLFWLLNRKSQRLVAVQKQNHQQKQVISHAKKAKQNIHDAHRLDADELDQRLQSDFRD